MRRRHRWVYFDDFEVTHVKGPVTQTDYYYPFGLTFNSYQRENAAKNNYLYNGKEKQDAPLHLANEIKQRGLQKKQPSLFLVQPSLKFKR